MSKDILVDSTVAKNFCNPLDPHYKEFVHWLFESGALVVTQRLLVEYHRTCAASTSATNIVALVDYQMRCGRLRRFRKTDLSRVRFSSRQKRELRSNKADHDNLKAVMLSFRKFALSHDEKFRHDVNNFPGHSARAEHHPANI